MAGFRLRPPAMGRPEMAQSRRQLATQHAPFSDNVANRRYDRNLSRRHGLTGELVLPDERRGQPLGPSLVGVVIRAIIKRVIHPAERGLFVISGCFVWLTFPPARMTSRLALTLPLRRTALARTAGRLIPPSACHQRDPVNLLWTIRMPIMRLPQDDLEQR